MMTQQSDHFSRHAGFELLRIISMMMIVLMHGIGHGLYGRNIPKSYLWKM